MLKFGFELGSILGNVRRIKMRLPYNQDGTGKTSIHTLQHILVETEHLLVCSWAVMSVQSNSNNTSKDLRDQYNHQFLIEIILILHYTTK